jgi:Zn-dependent protease
MRRSRAHTIEADRAEPSPMTSDARPPAAPRPGGLRLGRVLGIPVYLRWSWLLLATVVVILYAEVLTATLPQLDQTGRYAFAVGFVLCLLLSVLLHEIGHALVARHYGIPVRAITLEVLGGYTEMETDSPHPRADLQDSIIGPIVSAVHGGAALAAVHELPHGGSGQGVVRQLAFQLAFSNLLVAVFNALPGLPLDGGRAVRALVWRATGNRHTGTSVAGWFGRVLAVALVATAAVLGLLTRTGIATPLLLLLLAGTMWQGATVAILQGRILSRLPRLRLRELSRPVVAVPTGTPLAEAARRVAESALQDPAVAVADSGGRLVALVHGPSAAAVPTERRPWVPIDSVARAIDPGGALSIELTGEEIIRAIRAHPAPDYLVVDGTQVVGVLRVADLDKALR